ncbi:hypothetical protein AM1_0804 [Acaryochloris marina MBIC11017]|uniref:Uncharacterized protein n=1 Tax=Acaryochloris marina (strain MBIC 11017) TaxID=329726 RepID=B0BYG4_ACAM1|nr:hypothetical protein AM1_0804 [Acaryochloris marina MBIC11017]
MGDLRYSTIGQVPPKTNWAVLAVNLLILTGKNLFHWVFEKQKFFLRLRTRWGWFPQF